MSHVDQTWAPAVMSRYPSASSCQFISQDDFLSLAASVYVQAADQMSASADEPWESEGCTWGNAEGFFDALCFLMQQRLQGQAIATGHLVETPWSDEEEAEFAELLSGVGQSPTDMAHGCAAVDSAVGPAPVLHQVGDAQLDTSFFIGPEKQKLPSGQVVSHAQAAQEAATRV